MVEDRELERTQLRARLQAQLVAKERHDLSVLRKRICLTSAAVQREHQQMPRLLAERVPAHERLELHEHLVP